MAYEPPRLKPGRRLTNDRRCQTAGTWLQCNHMIVTTRIVRIGNSRGIRVPKLLLDRAALSEEVEIQAEPGRLVVRGVKRPRAGWAVAARAMHERMDDVELDVPTTSRFDRSGWKW